MFLFPCFEILVFSELSVAAWNLNKVNEVQQIKQSNNDCCSEKHEGIDMKFIPVCFIAVDPFDSFSFVRKVALCK